MSGRETRPLPLTPKGYNVDVQSMGIFILVSKINFSQIDSALTQYVHL